MLFITIFAACYCAGIINAIAGGGILLVFPTLLAAGIPPIVANATSNLASWPGALSSAYTYRAYLRRLPGKYLLLLLPCFFGAIIGAILLAKTDSDQFQQIVPWLVLAAVLLFIFQPFLHRHLAANLKAHRNAPLAVIGIALLPMSIYGGYFGAGFGFIMLAFLSFTRMTDIHQINGLKNLAGATISIVCTVYFTYVGLIDWRIGPAMIAGSLLGGLTGAHVATRLNPARLHLGIVITGLTVVGLLFLNQ